MPHTPSNADMDTTQATTIDVIGDRISLSSHSTQSLSYTSEPGDPNPDAMGQVERDLSDSGGGGDLGDEAFVGDDDVDMGDFSSLESTSTCLLEGCSNPTFVDSITDLESEYCSWKHQE